MPYQLTTVRQPVEAMARQAVQLLVERIEDRDRPPCVLLVPGELVVRQSARMEPP
jgi:DNA-binding LacI/PurR family transcriptional regulator